MHFIDTHAGSGKTYAMITEVKKSIITTKHVIVQPTNALLKETANNFDVQTNQYVRLLNSETVPEGQLLPRIRAALNDNSIRVILISEAMFYTLQPIDTIKCKIWMDDCVDFHKIYLGYVDAKDYHTIDDIYRNYILDNFSTYKGVNGNNYSTVTVRDPDSKTTTEYNKLISSLKELTNSYSTVVWAMYEPVGEQTGSYQHVVAFRDLSVYKNHNITYMSNNFKKTLLYLYNQNLFSEIKFTGRGDIDRRRLRVKYFFKKEDLPYGMTKSMFESPEGIKYTDKVLDYINTLNHNDLFYTMNVTHNTVLKGTECRPVLRGINTMQHMTACVWMSSMNPSPEEMKALHILFGLKSYDIKFNREYETMSQFVNRGIIRDRSSTEMMDVYVCTEDQALELVDNPEYVDIGIGSVKKERKKRKNEVSPRKQRTITSTRQLKEKQGRKSINMTPEQAKAFKAYKEQIKKRHS